MSSNLYQVDKIVGYKVSKGTPYYKVHWAGYSSRHDSWEPADNLTSCTNMIQDYHRLSKAEEPAKKKRFTRRSMALVSTPAPKVPTIEFSSEEEDQPTTLRRSQRARTPTHYFRSELPRHRRRTPTPQPRDIGNESEEEEGRGSSSLRVPEGKRPEKKTVVSEAVEMPTPYALRSASARHPTAPSAALSSDEETAGIGLSKLEATGVTPRISLYESKVRKRLNELSEMTKKSLSETISAKTKAAKQQQQQKQPSNKDVESTHSVAPSPPMTRSRAVHARQAHTVQPSTVYTRTKLRSRGEQQQEEKKKEEKEENKRKKMEEEEMKEPEVEIGQGKEGEEEKKGSGTDEPPSMAQPQPTQDLSTQEEHQPPQTADQGQAEPYYPQWMQLGWEEVTFALVILALMIFTYYCFYSESC